MEQRTALLLGASGLVGGYCLQALLKSKEYAKVLVLVRKPLDKSFWEFLESSESPRAPKSKLSLFELQKFQEHVIDFDNLPAYRDLIRCDDLYSCLGTTVLKTPKKEDYYRIDFEYPYEIAKIALINGATQCSFISALSASPKAFLSYSRIKGEFEDAITQLGFQSVYIMAPSFLDGERKEIRPIEKIGVAVLKGLKPILQGPLKKFRSIRAEVVAKVMVYLSLQHTPRVHKYRSEEIQKIYDQFIRKNTCT